MKPDRPRQSRHFGHVYKIRYVTGLKSKEGESLCGETSNDEALIEIDDAMPPTKERETLVHEVLHQLLEQHELPEDIEEGICSYLGAAIGGHIADNPLFWRYVTRRIPKEK